MSQPSDAPLEAIDFSGKLIIHFGTHKTGSTSIQAYCMEYYTSLRSGCLYPDAGRFPNQGQEVINHHPLTRSMIGDNQRPLDEQVAASDLQTVVLPREILSCKYLSSEPFETIRMLFPHPRRKWKIFMLRQVYLLVSQPMVDLHIYLDHRLRLEKLKSAAEDDPIRMLLFEEQKKHLLEHFFGNWGFTVAAEKDLEFHNRNPSLLWGTPHMLRLTNRLSHPLEWYARIATLLAARTLANTPAPFLVYLGLPLPMQTGTSIAQRCRASNRWVEANFFGSAKVFDPDCAATR